MSKTYETYLIMTQEEKELLLKDLCARLPYTVKCCVYDDVNDLFELSGLKDIDTAYFESLDRKGNDGLVELQFVKPYLRPMSSMTEEEAREIAALHDIKDILSVNVTDEYIDYIVDDGFSSTERRTLWHDELISSIECFDWLNEHHLDYRGLIPMGLALEAPEGMYKID